MTIFKISGEWEGLKNIEGHTVSLRHLRLPPKRERLLGCLNTPDKFENTAI